MTDIMEHATSITTINMRSMRTDMEFLIQPISTLLNGEIKSVISKPHRINFDALLFIEEGTGVHHIDYKRHSYKPGTVISVAKYQVHYFDANPNLVGTMVLFNDDLFGLGEGDITQDKIRLALESIDCIECKVEDFIPYLAKLKAAAKFQDNIHRELIRSLVRAMSLDLLATHKHTVDEKDTPDSKHFRRFKQALEKHYTQQLKVADYAAMLGLQTKRLNQITKQQTGITAKQLINDRVLIELKRKLAYSPDSIYDISLQLGFKEATNMSKFFRRYTELTPKEFRQLCKNGIQNKNLLPY